MLYANITTYTGIHTLQTHTHTLHVSTRIVVHYAGIIG